MPIIKYRARSYFYPTELGYFGHGCPSGYYCSYEENDSAWNYALFLKEEQKLVIFSQCPEQVRAYTNAF